MKQFSKEYAQQTPKAQWVKEHEHAKDQFDLSEVWEALQAKKEKAVEKPEK